MILSITSSVPTFKTLTAIINAHNQLQTDHNTLRAQYLALLAHMDTGNVTGLGARTSQITALRHR